MGSYPGLPRRARGRTVSTQVLYRDRAGTTVKLLLLGGALLSPHTSTSPSQWAPSHYEAGSTTESGTARGAVVQTQPVDAEVRALQSEVSKRARLTRQRIAAALGVDRRSLSAWASGETVPPAQRLEALRAFAAIVRDIDTRFPGRAGEFLTAHRADGSTVLGLFSAGRHEDARRHAQDAPSRPAINVMSRRESRPPLWSAAAAALRAGQLSAPSASRVIRSAEIYEMDLTEAAAFEEPESARRGRRTQ